MNLLIKQKLQAFMAHLGISLIVALIALLIVYGIWYPQPLDIAANVTRLFFLMIIIDIIIGPLLTLVVYKKGKKTLKFDLVVIALLQIAALIYGLYSVYGGRPAWIAYSVDRFDMVRANEIDTRGLPKTKPEYVKPSWSGYKYVNATLDQSDIELKNKLLFDEVSTGIAPSQRPELFTPIEEAYPYIEKRALPLKDLEKYNDKSKVQAVLSKHPEADSFVPLKANVVNMSVLIDKKSGGKVIAIVDLRPWN